MPTAVMHPVKQALS